MKLATANKRPMEVVGDFESAKFSLEVNSQAFAALSSGIYANKIGAVIRELSTNAIDAHVAAGNPAQFVVRLPNRNDPIFSVRDFGTGLSHDDVMKMYTTYFRSTKTNTNDATGCFGLGSKSPFAYTDSFTVVSYFNGKKRTYMLYKQHEVPQISIVRDENDNPIEEDTKEHNGLEVIIPVAPRDFDSFGSEANNIYRFFSMPPKIVGGLWSGTKVDKIKYENEFKVAGITPSQPDIRVCYHNDYNANCRVIMGNVAYSVKLPVGAVPSKYEHIANLKLDIYLNIGDVEVAISREALSYTAHTCKALGNVFANMATYAKNKIESELKTPKNSWEAAIQLRSLRSTKRFLFDMCPNADLSWNGKKIQMVATLAIPGTEIKVFNIDHYRKTKISDVHTQMQLEPRNTISLVVNDLRSSFNERCRQNLKYGATDIIYLVCIEDKTKALTSDQIKDEIVKQLDCSLTDIKLCSELPYDPKIANRSSRGGFGKDLLEFKGSYHRLYQCWASSTDDVSKGCYYVPIRNNYIDYEINNPTKQNPTTHPRELESWQKILNLLGFKVDKVYGIRYNQLKKIENKPEYIHVGKLIDSEVKKYINDPKRILDLQYAKLFRHRWNGYSAPQWFNDRLTSKNPELQSFLDTIKAAHKAKDKYLEILGNIESWTGISVKEDNVKKDLESKVKVCYKSYPLLSRIVGATVQEMQDYINLIEKEI